MRKINFIALRSAMLNVKLPDPKCPGDVFRFVIMTNPCAHHSRPVDDFRKDRVDMPQQVITLFAVEYRENHRSWLEWEIIFE